MEFNEKLNRLRQLNIRDAIWRLIAAYLLCILAHGFYIHQFLEFYQLADNNIVIEVQHLTHNNEVFVVTNQNDFPAFVTFNARISNTDLTDTIYFDYIIQPHQSIMLENPKVLQEYRWYPGRTPGGMPGPFSEPMATAFENNTIPAINSGNCRFDSVKALAVTLKDFETTLYIEFTWFVLLIYVVAFAVSWAVSNTKKQIAFDMIVGVPVCIFIATNFIRMFAGAHIGFTIFNINLY